MNLVENRAGLCLKNSESLSPKIHYSRSLRFGFRDGSLERKPNVNNEMKKITTV